MVIKAIFFDFDGTISDSYDLIYGNALKFFSELGYKVDKKELRAKLGEKMSTVLTEMKLKEDVNKIKMQFYSYLMNSVDHAKLNLCVPIRPLKELSKKYPLTIISNSQTGLTIKCAKKLGVINLFDKIYGAEVFTTKDDLMKKLFKKMNIKPYEAIYIGDRFSDVRYAKSAGCWAVAIHNKCSWSSRKLILKEKPDFIIKDFNGLKRVVERINRD
ncbi:Pyrophosphatase PpaX [uncultured archaeon]|nr:Pyrophosphatase PpaX [uncultured archaeon]